MADTKKEYTSNLHPKGDMDTTVYPNVKSENIIDKDTTAYTAGKVPDSSLVSRSLDGLNEKIETNKIQTDTNKTNIATLQGDVSSLKSDNETTKTTIAGLVSADTTNKANIAKNTQDIATNAQNIENLSAVIPTDINVDSNYNLILEHDGTEITGQKKLVKSPKYNNREYQYEYGKSYNFVYTGTRLNDSYNIKDYPYISFNAKNGYSIKMNNQSILFKAVGSYPYFEYSKYTLKLYGDSSERSISMVSYYQDLNPFIEIHTPSSGWVWAEFRTTSKKEKIAYMSDIPDVSGKQDKRFIHTVEIHYASNGSYFCFTGISDKNTSIDSIQDLITAFANRTFAGTGIFGSAGLSKIHVGSSVNDTTFKKYMNNGEYANPSEETFAMVFNTTGFTITDSVSAL